MIFLFLACINSSTDFKEITLRGTVSSTSESTGNVELVALREWSGKGILRYPMAELDRTTLSEVGAFEWTLLVEQNEDEGLALYGWLDSDLDGELCGLNGEPELSGLTVIDYNEVNYNFDLELNLEHSCVGVERLYGQE